MQKIHFQPSIGLLLKVVFIDFLKIMKVPGAFVYENYGIKHPVSSSAILPVEGISTVVRVAASFSASFSISVVEAGSARVVLSVSRTLQTFPSLLMIASFSTV